MNDVPKLFGSLVFNESVMKDRLPTATYKAYKAAVLAGTPLNLEIANIIANAMKDWALEHGCTHFTHWFSYCRRPCYYGLLRQRADSGRA